MDDIEGVLEDEVFGKFDDVTAAINQLQAARNAKLYATQFNQRIRADESLIKKLKLQRKILRARTDSCGCEVAIRKSEIFQSRKR